MSKLFFAVVLAALIALTAAAGAATPRASLPDIEDEVMCPSCGTVLGHAFSPQAERERQLIRREIAAGRTKAQIKDLLVAEYGDEVLATPDDSGFDLAAWLVPVGAVIAALVAIAVAVLRWRRRPAAAGEPGAELSPAESARLERDLTRYDR